MSEQLLNINDLANMMKIPAKTIRNKLCDGTWELLPIRIGKALRWRVENYLRQLRARASGELS